MQFQLLTLILAGAAAASPFPMPHHSRPRPGPYPTGAPFPFPFPFPTGTGLPFPTGGLPPSFPVPTNQPAQPPSSPFPSRPPGPSDINATQPLKRGFTLQFPASKGKQTFTAAKSVTGTFDGGMKTYGRGVSCAGQKEGGDADAVFLLADGATLKNAIIGADQSEGVHCKGACTIENVWWAAVCEDALSLKGDGNALVKGGGALGAEDKVIQHNGIGTVTIDGFQVEEFGKLYRSCGNCKGNGKARHVVVKNVKASQGKVLVGINSNYGDTATIQSTCATGVKDICDEYKGTNNNSEEPKKIGSGPSNACKYTSVPAC